MKSKCNALWSWLIIMSFPLLSLAQYEKTFIYPDNSLERSGSSTVVLEDKDGDQIFYLTTRITNQFGQQGYVLVKTNLDGTIASAWEYPVPHMSDEEEGPAMILANDGDHIVITGNTGSAILVFKVSTLDGSVVWSRSYDQPPMTCNSCHGERGLVITKFIGGPLVPNLPQDGYVIFGVQNSDYFNETVEKMVGICINDANGGLVWSQIYVEIPPPGTFPVPVPYFQMFSRVKPTDVEHYWYRVFVTAERAQMGQSKHGSVFEVDINTGQLVDNSVFHFINTNGDEVDRPMVSKDFYPSDWSVHIGWNNKSQGAFVEPMVMRKKGGNWGVDWVSQFDEVNELRGLEYDDDFNNVAYLGNPTLHHLIEIDPTTGSSISTHAFPHNRAPRNMGVLDNGRGLTLADQDGGTVDRFDLRYRAIDIDPGVAVSDCPDDPTTDLVSDQIVDWEIYHNWDNWAEVNNYPLNRIIRDLTSVDICQTSTKTEEDRPTGFGFEATTSPNPLPADGSAWEVRLTSDKTAEYTVQLVNIQGQVVHAEVYAAVEGENRFLLQPNQALSAGVYTMHVIDASGQTLHTEKLIRNK